MPVFHHPMQVRQTCSYPVFPMLWTLIGNSSLPFMQSSFVHISRFQYPWRTEEIIASIFSQNRTLQGHLKDRLDSVREIVTVGMDETDDGLNLAIFNAEGGLARRSPIGGGLQLLAHSNAFTSPSNL
jgi:hypothetical protein